MIKDAEIENNIEGTAKRLRAHFPKIHYFELDVTYPDNRLYQFRLLNKLRAAIKADDFRAEQGALDGPEAGVAGNIEHPLSSKRTTHSHKIREKMHEALPCTLRIDHCAGIFISNRK